MRWIRVSCFAMSMLAATAGASQAFTSLWDAASGLLPTQMNCPWTLVNNTNAPVLAAGMLTISTTTVSANTYYQQTQAQLSMPADSLVIEFNARYISGATSSTARAPISILLEVSAFRGTAFFIGATEIFFISANLTRGGTATVATSDAFHTYRLVVVGTALRIYQDGALKLTGSTFFDNSSGAFAGYPRILWGEGSSLAFGTSQWKSFEHNAAPGADCQVTPTRRSTWGGVKTSYR